MNIITKSHLSRLNKLHPVTRPGIPPGFFCVPLWLYLVFGCFRVFSPCAKFNKLTPVFRELAYLCNKRTKTGLFSVFPGVFLGEMFNKLTHIFNTLPGLCSSMGEQNEIKPVNGHINAGRGGCPSYCYMSVKGPLNCKVWPGVSSVPGWVCRDTSTLGRRRQAPECPSIYGGTIFDLFSVL